MHNRELRERGFNLELGARLRSARFAASITQADLASAVGLTRGSIANMERGQQAPSPFRLACIARELQLPLQDLVPDVEEPDVAPRHQLAVDRVWRAAEKKHGVRRAGG